MSKCWVKPLKSVKHLRCRNGCFRCALQTHPAASPQGRSEPIFTDAAICTDVGFQVTHISASKSGPVTLALRKGSAQQALTATNQQKETGTDSIPERPRIRGLGNNETFDFNN
jgi:hypothetical protein